eukprot:GHVN01063983.1.p1 GENE.GHVN01063983.1~~GHVN01063983.1.p1  ORF type:complete len:109 (+),score=7.60 GHVN01063983.1:39-329(+)
MASVIEARRSIDLYRRQREIGGADGTTLKRLEDDAVNATSQAVSRECHRYVEEFNRCYRHCFRLENCDDQVTHRLLTCRSRTADYIMTPQKNDIRG